MAQTYKIIDTEQNETMFWTLPEILHEINRDRGDSWQDYNESDWREGLAEFCYPLMLAEKEG